MPLAKIDLTPIPTWRLQYWRAFFDLMLLSLSPHYTSKATDSLIPIIREYLDEI